MRSEGYIYLHHFQFYSRAAEILNAGLPFAQAAKDSAVIAGIYSDLGSAYFHQEALDSSAFYFTQAFLIDQQLKDSAHISSDLNNLGRLYIHWKDYRRGLDYYHHALAILDTVKKKRTHAILLNNIGMAYQEMGELDSAFIYIHAGLSKSLSLGDSILIAHRLNNLGLLAIRQGQFNSARQNFQKSLAIYRRRGLHTWIARVLANLGQLSTKQGRYREAADHYQLAVEIAEEHQSLENLLIIYQGLTDHYRTIGQFRLALNYQERLAATKDSIFQLENKHRLEEFNIQYATASKEAEIDQLALQNQLQQERLMKIKNQRRALGLLVVGIILGGTLLFYLYRFRKKIQQKENEQTIALQMQEIDHLQAQIFAELHQKPSHRTSKLSLAELNALTFTPITQREYEILEAISQGLSNKEISEAQFVSINTVKFHLKNIYDKLDVKNRVQAVKVLSNRN